jgi:hypothetical protein
MEYADALLRRDHAGHQAHQRRLAEIRAGLHQHHQCAL